MVDVRSWSVRALWASSLVVLTLSSWAHADVPLPGLQPSVFQDRTQRYAPLTPSRACLQCHGNFAVENYEAWDTWRGSMMGNAVVDPVFLAALSVAEDDIPGSGDFCLRCHAPEAWLEGRSTPSDGSELERTDDGVSCHFCHRLVETDPSGEDPLGPYIGNARFFLAKESFMRGPYSDVTIAPHQTRQSDYFSDSRICGLCHDVSNPLVAWRDHDGHELGPEFPLERTYSEWLRSAFAAEGSSCQSCHMPPFEGTVCSLTDAPSRPDVFTHQIVGANTWVPLALTVLNPEDAEVPSRAELWAATRDAAIEMLRQAATLGWDSLPESVAPEQTLAFQVRVTNLSGHRLPTGYPEGRRMWLEVTITDGAGATVLESGTYDAEANERLADGQLRTYEVELGVVGEGPGMHFIRSDTVLSDTRIPPRGFAPTAEDSGLLPVGRDYGDGSGGYHDYDVAPYAATVPCDAEGPLSVRVRLLQQTASRRYIEFLRDTQATEIGVQRGRTLYDAWTESGQSEPVVMAELEGNVELEPGGEDAGPQDAGQPGPGGGGGCCAVAGTRESSRAELALWLAAAGMLVARAARRLRRHI